MVGIVLASHGSVAESVLETSQMFYGPDDVKQVTCAPLHREDALEDYKNRLSAKVAEVDAGEGVIIVVDLRCGTPGNQASLLVSDTVQVITGLSLQLFMELLEARAEGIVDIIKLVETARDSIVSVNEALKQSSGEDDDSFF